ncbi:hypothetical protein CFSAN002350_001276 [Listeria monocytogenes CFSAN002350]|nr:hypothetical protein DYZ47_01931 [Listeria monocytogenes]RKF93069.1 hypothetical protein CFSAN002350_001276 [Listeria monocytogenes CFSAN002350]
MKGLIINKMHSGYFTNMSEVFNLLPEEELNCMWLVSSYEVIYILLNKSLLRKSMFG